MFASLRVVFNPTVDLGIKLFLGFIEVFRDTVDEFLEFFFSLGVVLNPAIDLGVKLVKSLMRVLVDLVHKLFELVHELLMTTLATVTLATMTLASVMFAFVVLATLTAAMLTSITFSLMNATVTLAMLATNCAFFFFFFFNKVGEEVKAIGLHVDIDWHNLNQNGINGLFSDPSDIDFKVEFAFLRDLFELRFDLIHSVLVLVNPVLGMGVDLLGCISDVIGELVDNIRVLLNEFVEAGIQFVNKIVELVGEVVVLSLAVGDHDQSQ